MLANGILGRLTRTDARLIGRDNFLRTLVIYIVFMAGVLRFGLPWLADLAAQDERIPFALAEYYPLIIGFVVLYLGPVLAGMIVGFMLLDERDDRTLQAILVTPLKMSEYMLYRTIVPWMIGVLVILGEIWIIQQALLPIEQTIIIALGAALTGPLIALMMGNFAENKVQGFALNKVFSSAGLLLIASYFVQEPLQYLFGLFPPFWFAKAYWLAGAGDPNWIVSFVVGLGLMLTVLIFLYRRFLRLVYSF